MKKLPLITFLFIVGCSSELKYPDGGYNYPNHVADEDSNFYYYPVKNALSRKDSFDYARDSKFWKIFKEPNLSIRPWEKDLFRFVYSGWASRTYIILLTEDSITIKSGDNALVYEEKDSALSKTEEMHFRILRRWFPLDELREDTHLNYYLDSMIKTYPCLLDPQYYQALEDKSYTYNISNLHEKITSLPISKKDFNHFAMLFNESGFWKMPFLIKCNSYPMDGYGFCLEANTKTKYQVVKIHGCSPGNATVLAKACQQLVEFVHLEKEISCYRNPADTSKSAVVVQDVQLEEIKQSVHKKKHRTPHR